MDTFYFMDNTKSVITPPTRASRAKRTLRPVIDADTKAEVGSDFSPFAPLEVEFTYGGKIYFALYRAQDVNDALYERMTIEQQRQFARAGITKIYTEVKDEKGAVLRTEQKPFAEIVGILSDGELDNFFEIQSGEFLRGLRVKAFGGHVEDWNVPDEQGDVADFGMEAFETKRGIYDAALGAFETAFLNSRGRATEATAKPEVSSTTGDTPSTPPETDSLTTDSDESRAGRPNSD